MERVRQSVERDSGTLSATASWHQSSLPIYRTVSPAGEIFFHCVLKCHLPLFDDGYCLCVCVCVLQEGSSASCYGAGCLVSFGHCWPEPRNQDTGKKQRTRSPLCLPRKYLFEDEDTASGRDQGSPPAVWLGSWSLIEGKFLMLMAKA